MFSKCQFLAKDGVLIFWGNPHDVPVNSEYSQELCRKMNDLGLCDHLPHLLSSKISPPNVELSFYQVHCSCPEDWFCGKVRLDDFYPLLRNIASTWIHIDVKRISQACCLHHLKNMEKSFVKHNFGIKNKMGCFFWATLYSTYMYSIIY